MEDNYSNADMAAAYRSGLEQGHADMEHIVAQHDQLQKALKMAVERIEDDRFDDEYIMEYWYHVARVALKEVHDD